MSKPKDDALTLIERDLRRFVIPTLRRASLRFYIKRDGVKLYPRNEALKSARVERGLYKCSACGELFKSKEVVVDHINPVVPLTGDTYSWDDFINGLFVTPDKLQVLCIADHDIKSNVEDNLRAHHREVKREEEKVAKKLEKANKKLAKSNNK